MWKQIVSLILVSLVWATFGMAATPEKRRADTLRALPGVYFVVEELGAEVEADGLTTIQIQQDVEFTLRRAGVRVMSEPEWASMPGKPFLYVRVSTVKDGSRYAFHLGVELFQRVRLERYQEMAPVQAPTWSAREEIGVIDARRVQELRRYLADQVEQFLEAYLAVNTV